MGRNTGLPLREANRGKRAAPRGRVSHVTAVTEQSARFLNAESGRQLYKLMRVAWHLA
jgi:hypothetical protein